jgi:hypothetical protein
MKDAKVRSRGQALAEFALVAPIFFLLLFGIIEFGRYVYNVQVLNNAAREGARYAVVHGALAQCESGPLPATATNVPCDPPGQYICDIVANYAVGVVGGSGAITTTVRWVNPNDPNDQSSLSLGCPRSTVSSSTNARENQIVVHVSYQYEALIPVVPLPPVRIDGESSLVINN